jgi:hypothetical protein
VTIVGAPRAPWTERAFEILSDGEWHDQADLIDACAPLVPPGVAYRKGELRRRNASPSHSAARLRGDQHLAVAAGARAKVHDCLASPVRDGRIERRYVDGRPQLRTAQ